MELSTPACNEASTGGVDNSILKSIQPNLYFIPCNPPNGVCEVIAKWIEDFEKFVFVHPPCTEASTGKSSTPGKAIS